MQPMDKLKQLKIPKDILDVKFFKGVYEDDKELPEDPKNEWMIHCSRINVSNCIVICYDLLGNKKQSKKFAKLAVVAGIDYFEGSWRSIPIKECPENPKKWLYQNFGWIDEFRWTIMCALYLHDYESAKRFAAYPSEECTDYMDYCIDDWACYLLMASVIKDGRMDNEKLLKKVSAGKKKKPKLIVEILKAIVTKDHIKFNETFSDYLKYIKRSEFKRSHIDTLQSIDGTILYHLAEIFELPISGEIKNNPYIIV